MRSSLIFISIAILSCQSNKKKEAVSPSIETNTAIQDKIENNIHPIDENGKSDSIATTLESRMKALNIPGQALLFSMTTKSSGHKVMVKKYANGRRCK